MKNLRLEVYKAAEKKSAQMGPISIVMQKVMQELNNPHSSAKSIEKAIAYDQAFSARVLRMANSAFYGYGGKIKTVSQAIVVLGINTLKALLMAAAANKVLNQNMPGYHLKGEQFWEHAVLTAVSARELSRKLKEKNPEEFFSAGILHDMGKVFMDPFLAKEAQGIYDLMKQTGMRMDEAELQELGVHHGMVGKRIAQSWNFPEMFQEVMAYHHAPKKSQNFAKTCAIVGLSSNAAWEFLRNTNGALPPPSQQEIEEHLSVLQLQDSVYREMLERMDASWKDVQNFLK